LIHPDPSCLIWTSTFRDISYQNGPSLLGAAATTHPMDTGIFDGFWNINNIIDCAFNIGGSDCRLSPWMLLLNTEIVVRNIVGESYTADKPVIEAINATVANGDDSVALVTS
jgi:hypothetical protein